MTDITNVSSSLDEIPLTNDSNIIVENTAMKRRDVGLARLHALLTMGAHPDRNPFKRTSNSLTGNPSSTRSGYFRHAEAKALSQRKYYSRATAILNEPHDHDTEVFPFLALPVELRLIIYHELLVSDDRLVLTWRSPRRASKLQKEMHIGILMTCKLCANEGIGVLYGENLFDFGKSQEIFDLHHCSYLRVIQTALGQFSNRLSFLLLQTGSQLTVPSPCRRAPKPPQHRQTASRTHRCLQLLTRPPHHSRVLRSS